MNEITHTLAGLARSSNFACPYRSSPSLGIEDFGFLAFFVPTARFAAVSPDMRSCFQSTIGSTEPIAPYARLAMAKRGNCSVVSQRSGLLV